MATDAPVSLVTVPEDEPYMPYAVPVPKWLMVMRPMPPFTLSVVFFMFAPFFMPYTSPLSSALIVMLISLVLVKVRREERSVAVARQQPEASSAVHIVPSGHSLSPE